MNKKIFSESWWLDITSPNQWDQVLIIENASEVASWPFVIRKKYGLKVLTQPTLTPTLGPWFRPFDGKNSTRLDRLKSFSEELLAKLPRYDYFRQNFSYEMEYLFPFIHSGFLQSFRLTYLLNHSSEKTIWDSFGSSSRRKINNANKNIKVAGEPDLERAYAVFSMSFQRQDRKPPVGWKLFENLVCRSVELGRGQLYSAKDQEGRIHAIAFYVWDSKYLYYLIGGGDPELRGSFAGNLIIWEGLRLAAQNGLIFDFEGSMIPGIEEFFRSFGGRPTQYSRFTGFSGYLAPLRRIKTLI